MATHHLVPFFALLLWMAGVERRYFKAPSAGSKRGWLGDCRPDGIGVDSTPFTLWVWKKWI